MLRLAHGRYGDRLPNSSTGRRFLAALLATSAGVEAVAVWTLAPWCSPADKLHVLDLIAAQPVKYWSSGAKIGRALELMDAERRRWRLWPLWPCDVTRKQIEKRNLANKRQREAERRKRDRWKARPAFERRRDELRAAVHDGWERFSAVIARLCWTQHRSGRWRLLYGKALRRAALRELAALVAEGVVERKTEPHKKGLPVLWVRLAKG